MGKSYLHALRQRRARDDELGADVRANGGGVELVGRGVDFQELGLALPEEHVVQRDEVLSLGAQLVVAVDRVFQFWGERGQGLVHAIGKQYVDVEREAKREERAVTPKVEIGERGKKLGIRSGGLDVGQHRFVEPVL